MLINDNLAQWDRENFFHPSTHLAQHARGETPTRIITGGEGVYIRDRDGRSLLDAFAGLYCVNVGYGRQEIAEAIGMMGVFGGVPAMTKAMELAGEVMDTPTASEDDT